MMPKAEEFISLALRTVLQPLAARADIPESDALGEFKHVLVGFLPDLLEEEHVWWLRSITFEIGGDSLQFTLARKVGPGEAEFFGYAYLVPGGEPLGFWDPPLGDPPLYLRLRAVEDANRLAWVDFRLGGEGSSLSRREMSKRALNLRLSPAENLDSFPWAHTFTRESPQPAAMKFHCPCCGFQGLDQPAYERLGPPPWGDLGEPPYASRLGEPSYDVCACCGFQYGLDDETATRPGDTFAQYLAKRIREGWDWFGPGQPLPGWDLKRQLAEAGISWPSDNG